MRNKINIHHDELIRRREDYYRRERNHDDEIVFMKINSTKHRKEKNSKSEQGKKFKNEKKCYNCCHEVDPALSMLFLLFLY